MATVLVMPKLGLTMTEGTIEEWFKREGDYIEKGEPLVGILTDKISYNYEAPESGILRKILHVANEVVAVSEAIAIIGSADEDILEIIHQKTEIQQEKQERRIEKMDERSYSKEKRILVSPLAKKIAKEKGIDLQNVVGTGPEGRITKEDVEKILEKVETQRVPSGISTFELIPVSGIRRIIGQRMSESKKTIPHISLSIEVDMTDLLGSRERIFGYLEKEKGVRVSLTEFLVKIVSEALKMHPLVNSTFEDKHIKLYKEINIGVAMAAKEGLIVPVIQKANECSINEISSRMKELTQRVQSEALSLDDVSNGTFTLSNLGMYGIDKFTAIINPPQCAILAVGRISKKPVAVDNEVVVRPMAWVTLSVDHRILDGKQAAEFLVEIKGFIENPYILLT